jgi:hypothetical protein
MFDGQSQGVNGKSVIQFGGVRIDKHDMIGLDFGQTDAFPFCGDYVLQLACGKFLVPSRKTRRVSNEPTCLDPRVRVSVRDRAEWRVCVGQMWFNFGS